MFDKIFRLNSFVLLALDFRTAVKTVRKNFPVSSYSSSDDDDDFYDADDTIEYVLSDMTANIYLLFTKFSSLSPSTSAADLQQTAKLTPDNSKSSKLKANESTTDANT